MLKVKANWLDQYGYNETISVLSELALLHASLGGDPHGPAISDLITNRDWKGLLDYKLDYVPGMDTSNLIHCRQALAFFQKLEPLKVKGIPSKEETALKKFIAAEERCRETNERFRLFRMGTYLGAPHDEIISIARKRIQDILGTVPALEELKMSFGGGATTNVMKKESCPRVKLGAPLECSFELGHRVAQLLEELPALAAHHSVRTTEDTWLNYVNIVPGRLQFVPKNAKTYRAISVEPGLNTLIQQGYGKYIRQRLLQYADVDLRDQTRNQRLARKGSIDGSLATVDFSSASDTIASDLVATLLPLQWFEALHFCRTRTVELNGVPIKLEKFSSMGNSFTFELESLIFYSLAWATMKVCHPTVSRDRNSLSIYGDDLIIPSECYHDVFKTMTLCGFEVNTEKTYWSGPFRESCGADYYIGTDIRPFYQKALISGQTLFCLHNFYMRNGEVLFAARVREMLHPTLHIFGPDDGSDGHLIGSWTPLRKRVTLVSVDSEGQRKTQRWPTDCLGWEGVAYISLREVSMQNKIPHSGDSVLPFYSIYVSEQIDDGREQPLQRTQYPRDLWLDARHLTVPGTRGYERILVYTNRNGVFIP